MPVKVNYNNYDFPSTIRPMSVGFGVDLGEVELPRRDGAATQAGRVKGRTLVARGVLQDDDPAALAAGYDALKAACFGGSRMALPLYFGVDDRYILAQLQEWSDDYALGEQSGVCYRVNIAMTFFAGDPFWYSVSPVSVPLSGNGATAVSVGGDAPAAAVWTWTAGSSGAGAVTLANSATGEAGTITRTFAAGDAVELDTADYAVLVNGTAQFGALSGRIPSLAAGVNGITIEASGVTVSGASVAYTSRYL